MNQYVTGAVIRELREKNRMTQLQLAEKLGVSDKSVSKWETGKGYPDITLLEPIAEAFRVSVTELISGNNSVPAASTSTIPAGTISILIRGFFSFSSCDTFSSA